LQTVGLKTIARTLTDILAVFKKPKKQNMAALSPEELPEFMDALSQPASRNTAVEGLLLAVSR
jgi:uncharacterized protein (DUF1778 family)